MTALLLTVALLAGTSVGANVEPVTSQRAADSRTLRERIESRFEVVPLSRGIGLRPKSRIAGVRLIELTDEAIAIDGSPVTGRELRERLGADAEPILQLSYLSADARREALGLTESTDRPAVAPPPEPTEREREREAEPEPREEESQERPSIPRHRIGERVKVFGSLHVERDEAVDGQAVAVLGSARVDGEVNGQVVAVLGNVELGPDARVDGDVIAVGGRLRRAPGAVVTGDVREISFTSPEISFREMPRWAWFAPFVIDPFEPSMRLMGTVFRLLLLALLCSIAVLLARGPVDTIAYRLKTEPLKAAIVGVLGELLFVPAFVLTCVILAVTIIGIPLLLFMPFVLVAFLFVLLVGFAAAAYVVGQVASERIGSRSDQPYFQVFIGLVVLLSPLLLARLLGVAGGPLYFFAIVLSSLAFLVEYVAWTMGFGAALIGIFNRWQARRPAAVPAVPPSEGTSGPAPPV